MSRLVHHEGALGPQASAGETTWLERRALAVGAKVRSRAVGLQAVAAHPAVADPAAAVGAVLAGMAHAVLEAADLAGGIAVRLPAVATPARPPVAETPAPVVVGAAVAAHAGPPVTEAVATVGGRAIAARATVAGVADLPAAVDRHRHARPARAGHRRFGQHVVVAGGVAGATGRAGGVCAAGTPAAQTLGATAVGLLVDAFRGGSNPLAGARASTVAEAPRRPSAAHP